MEYVSSLSAPEMVDTRFSYIFRDMGFGRKELVTRSKTSTFGVGNLDFHFHKHPHPQLQLLERRKLKQW